MNKKKNKLHDEIVPQMAETLKALGHPLRLRLFEALAGEEKSVGQLVLDLEIPQAIASQQLRIMKQGQVVQCRRQGALMLYRLTHDGLLNLLKCLYSCQDHCLLLLPPKSLKKTRKGE